MKKQPSQAGRTPGSPGDPPAPSSLEKPSSSTGSEQPAERPKALRIPPLLLEGDDPPPSVSPVQPQKFALAPAPVAPSPARESVPGELPESYGTGHLLLLARDPHCLYAHWDLSSDQQKAYCALSSDKQLVLRVSCSSSAPTEMAVPAGSNSRFIQVQEAGVSYVAELGYYRQQEWIRLATSDPAVTPSASISIDRAVRFAETEEAEAMAEAKLPREESKLAPITPPSVQWIPALESGPREAGQGNPHTPLGRPEWTPEQERALAEMLGTYSVSRPSPSSLELTEWVRREIERDIAALQFGQSVPQAISSPLGAEPPRLHAFWFNVNAELIVYGATDPTATVTVAGRPIPLRPDGTFSCRFALPDGEYELELAATSVLQEERHAKLKFRRCSEYRPSGGPG